MTFIFALISGMKFISIHIPRVGDDSIIIGIL